MRIAVHWHDADTSANAVAEVFPGTQIMICSCHAGRAYCKQFEAHAKQTRLAVQVSETIYRHVQCVLSLHRQPQAWLRVRDCSIITKAHTNFTSISVVSNSQEEFC